jgi:predicted Fe-Mo cluster-binding NifX family protein
VRNGPINYEHMTKTTSNVAFPILTNDGLNSCLSLHYGRAPMHMLTDADGKIIAVLNGDPAVGGKSLPLVAMLENGVKTVICPGLGRKAQARLTSEGMAVLATSAKTVSEALAQLNSGGLLPVSEAMLVAHDLEVEAGTRGIHRGEGCCHEHGHEAGSVHVRCCEKTGRQHEHKKNCGEGRGHCCRHGPASGV